MDTETAGQPVVRVSRAAPSLGFIGTSVVASAVGVVVAAFVDNLGVAVGGLLAGRDAVLFHNEVLLISEGSPLALAGGIIAALLTGAFFLVLYPGSNSYDAARLTTLWIVLHCFRQGFTQLAALPFASESNAALALEALDIPAGLDLVLSVAGVVGLLSVALASAPAFLAYARRQAQIETPSQRFGYTAKLALIPGVAGPLLTVPFFMPDNDSGFIETLPLLGLFTVATVLAAIGTRTVRVATSSETQRFSWLPVAWFLALLVIYQVVLSRGLLIPPDLAQPFANSL